MDVDSADFAATAVATAEDDVQPIQVQRARRTYASKPKLTAVSNDERPSDLYSSSASGSLRTNAAAGPQSSTTTTTATSTYQPGHWRNLLAEIDKDSEMGSDDDKERLAAPRTALQLKTGKDAHTLTSSPPSPGASRSTSRPASRPREQTHQQYSANTSFASGTSGAISSPSSRTVPLTSPLDLFASDPLDALPSDDDASPVSEVPSSKQGTLPLRDKTPDSPARNRALEPSVFESPHRSFARATAQLKERKQPKFLGDDDDSDEEMAITSTRSDVKDAKMDDIEAELGWFTDGSDKSRSRRRKSDKLEAKNKIKKPTKKDVIEAEKETARMRAERELDVQGKAAFEPLSFASHFQKRAELLRKSSGNGRPLNAVPPAPKPFGKPTRDDPAATDPISNFSSSPGTGPSEPSFDLEKAREDLRRRKLQAAQAPAIVVDLDDSSDIEIVPETPGHAISPLDPAKKLEQIISKKKQKSGPMDVKKKALKPRGSTHEMSKDTHNRMMREKAAAQSTEMMQNKKTDFLERGGLLTKQAKAAASKGRNVLDLLDRAKVVADAAEQARQDSDDDNDPSYEPEEDQATLHGSSPTKIKPKVLVPDSSMVEGAMADVTLEEENDTSRPIEISEHSETEDENEVAPAQQGNQKRRNNIVLSDEEDENLHQASDGENIPPHQRSFSMSSENARFDLFSSLTRSVTATASRTPLGEITTEKGKDLFSDLPLSPISPISPLQTLSPTQHKMKIDIPTSAQRSPLKRSGSSLLPAFEQSPTTSKRSAGASSPFGFSAIFGTEDEDKPGPGSRSGNSSVGVKPVNFGEISTQLFFSQPSPSQRASPIKKARSSFGERDPLAELRAKKDSDDFLLTQDGPLGRIELSTQQARDLQVVDQVDADAAFREGEEERRKKLQEAQVDEEPKWINDAGLFTQTKPAEVPWSLTQNLLSQPPLFFPQFTDLNAETMLSQRSPGKTPSRRLKRKGELADRPTTAASSSPPQSEEASSPEKFNALQYLMKPKKHRELDENNEFVYGEAEESDDDLALGFTNHRGADDEEAHIDPEEEAKYLDDKKMSIKDIREEAIIEKHREHLEHDDAELQKIHQAAADGRLRKGKRSHGLLDDDSSEDEEKARGKKFKKRKVIGTDHLDDIARNPETSAFYKTYMRDLPGADEADPEDNEFAHLNVEADDVEADADYESDNGDEEMESGSEAGEGGKKTITTNEILRIVQEKEERGEDLVDDEELMDAEEYVRHHMPSSDALMPGEYDNIKIISPRKRPGTKIVRKDVDVLLSSRFKGAPVDEAHALRLAVWAKQNEKAREITARGIASSAVTGHAKTAPSRTKSDKSSLSKTSSMQARPPVRSETKSSLSSKLSKKDSAWE